MGGMVGKSKRWWEVWLRAAMSAWRLLLLALVCALVLAIVSRFYLLPAADSLAHGTPNQQKAIHALNRLLLAILLTMLVVGVMWAARKRR